MVWPQWNFASNVTLYSDILKGVLIILKSAVLIKDPVGLGQLDKEQMTKHNLNVLEGSKGWAAIAGVSE